MKMLKMTSAQLDGLISTWPLADIARQFGIGRNYAARTIIGWTIGEGFANELADGRPVS